MTMEIPPQFKPLTAYIRRAEELDKDTSNPNSAVVAYHCRLYAINKGMSLNLPKSDMSFLLSIMDIAELAKKQNPTISANGKEICEDFALGVFSNSDNEDRSVGSTMMTAKGFYAAAAFFDVLEQFGELEHDMAEKRRYCKWKAADIARAVKEGRKPMQGGMNEGGSEATEGEEATGIGGMSAPVVPVVPDFGIPMAPVAPVAPSPAATTPAAPVGTAASYEIPSAPSSAPFVPPPSLPIPGYSPQPPPAQHYQQQYQPPVAKPVQQQPPQQQQYHHTPSASGPPRTMNDPRAKDCVELCQFAIAAMKHNDVNLARERLQAALRMLD